MIARQMCFACLVYLSLVLQTSLASDVALGAFQPWLPGVSLALCLMLTDATATLFWAAVLGFGVDCLSGQRLGVHVVVATVVTTGLLMFRTDRRPVGIVAFGTLVLAGTFLWRTLSVLAQGMLDRQMIDAAVISVSGIYSALVAIGLLLVIRFIIDAMGIHRQSGAVQLANRWTMLTG
jgi:cell shape-determining protein MreD